MRTYFYIAVLLIGFTACNDGDIIVNNFDFEDDTLTSCAEDGRPKVFYKINTDDIFESISLVTNNASISSLAQFLNTTTDPISFNLDSNNKINYRMYDGTVTNDYFCSTLPPSSPKVIQEFVSVGGTVKITTEENSLDLEDSDGDGVPNSLEKVGDTDDDGIPDIWDTDDDGDNVLTSSELATANNDAVTADGYRDTDQDDTPNYLDPDDDGDDVPTKNEVTTADQSPVGNVTNGLPAYLDRNVSNSFEGVTLILENRIGVIYRSLITIERLKLQNQDGSAEEIAFDVYDFGEFVSKNTTKLILPTPAPEEN